MENENLARCATSQDVEALAETLKVISDVNRLRIICLLFGGEKCVCEIEGGLAVSQPLASHHLRVLLESGLVEVRREGTWSYYSLNPGAIKALDRSFREFLGSERFPEAYTAGEGCCRTGA